MGRGVGGGVQRGRAAFKRMSQQQGWGGLLAAGARIGGIWQVHKWYVLCVYPVAHIAQLFPCRHWPMFPCDCGVCST